MQTLEQLLSEQPFFKDLAPRHVKLIAGCGKNTYFDEGQFIFREGGDAGQFYLIRHGQVALEIHSPQKGPVMIQTISENEMLGWSWLFPPHRWHFDARVVRPVRATAFDGKCLRKKCDEDHDLGYELVTRFSRIIVERLQTTRLQLLDLYGHDH